MDTITTPQSVFGDGSDIFTVYEVEATFREKIMGGVPMRRNVIEGWIKAGTGIEDVEERRRLMLKTLIEMGVDVHEGMSDEEIDAAAEKMAESHTNGFKRDETGLYIEGRQIKAMLKESVNILYAGDRWGKTRKGPRSFVAERLFPQDERIYLGRKQADDVALVVGHVSDAAGKRSTLAYHEYVERAVITFRLEMLRDELTQQQWREIFLHAERNGLGALRSQGHGQFRVTRFERVENAKVTPQLQEAVGQ